MKIKLPFHFFHCKELILLQEKGRMKKEGERERERERERK
jgi:hypothetical protein